MTQQTIAIPPQQTHQPQQPANPLLANPLANQSLGGMAPNLASAIQGLPPQLGNLLSGMTQQQQQQAIQQQIRMLQRLQQEQIIRAHALHQLGGMVNTQPFQVAMSGGRGPPNQQQQQQQQLKHDLQSAPAPKTNGSLTLTSSDFASIVNTPASTAAPVPPPLPARYNPTRPVPYNPPKADIPPKAYIPKPTKTRKVNVSSKIKPQTQYNKKSMVVVNPITVYSTIPTIQSVKDEPPPLTIPNEIITCDMIKSDVNRYLLSKFNEGNLWKNIMRKAHQILIQLDHLLRPGTSLPTTAYFEICKEFGFTVRGKQFYFPAGWPRNCQRVNEIKNTGQVAKRPPQGSFWYRSVSAVVGAKAFRNYLVNVAERPWMCDWTKAFEVKDWTPWLTTSLSTLDFKSELQPPPQVWTTGVPCLRGIMRATNWRITIQGFWSNHRSNLFRPITNEAIKEASTVNDTNVSEFMWSSGQSTDFDSLPPKKDIRFGGQFIFKDQSGTEANIPEKQIDVKFSRNSEGNLNIAGEGTNEFGDFRIIGVCIRNHEGVFEACIYKVFKSSSELTGTGVDVESIQCSCADCPDKRDESIPILLCDICDEGFHTTCLGLKEVPPGDSWFCNRCAPKRPKLVQQATELLVTLSKMVNSPSDGGPKGSKQRIDRMFMIAAAYGWTETANYCKYGRKERCFGPSPTLTKDSELFWPKPRVHLNSYSMFEQYLKWVIDPETNEPPVEAPAPPPPPPPKPKPSRGYSQPIGTYHSLIDHSSAQSSLTPNQILKTYTNHGEVFDRRYFREETIPDVDLPIFSAIPPPDYLPKEIPRVNPLPNYAEVYGPDIMYDEARHGLFSREKLLELARKNYLVNQVSKSKQRDAFMLKCYREEFRQMAKRAHKRAAVKAANEKDEENYKIALMKKFPDNEYLRKVYIEARSDPR
ncbi:hypothetical protein TrLO_g8294 [Triparma laevis f. longispina]|uniref:PHD-type domain-containing protein n=1 Tax=Triparma laevis f. longispina TaxID=1714387 RepID=A0A9W7AAT3_9STRA|nr:hypothetical protein TrLO_g8294 [Triparma laevis f. longispina]